MRCFFRAFAAPLVAVSLTCAPVAAEEEDGFNLMQEGAKLLFRGLMTEMEPALEEFESLMGEMQPLMRDFMTEMGPALKDLMAQVEDWSMYHPPEMLPNGDIIIRRKTPRTDPEPPTDIEL